ncbi:MAG TPA: hypothetical protein PLY45_03955 [bacterium]|nr:hypothetical protein [bacterium]
MGNLENNLSDNQIHHELLRDEIYKRAQKDGYAVTCNPDTLNAYELKECEERRNEYVVLEDMFLRGTRLAVDRNDDKVLTASEFKAGQKFIEDNYKALFDGCLSSHRAEKSYSAKDKKEREEKFLNCRADWFEKNAAPPHKERQARPWYKKILHFLWDLVTNR